MKKGLRPHINFRLPPEGETQTDLMKKGLRPLPGFGFARVSETQTDLMKKGLRPSIRNGDAMKRKHRQT